MTVDEEMAFSFKVLPKQFLNGIWWLLSLILIVGLNGAALIFMVSLIDDNSTIPFYAMLDSGYMPDLDRYLVFGLLTLLILLVIDFVYCIFATAYVFRLGIDGWNGQERRFGERLSLAYREGWALAGVGGLYVLAVIVMMGVSFGVTFASVFTDLNWILIIQIGFNFVSTIVMYYISVKLSCWIPLIMEEYYGTFEAWRMSFNMTKGRGWRIFGYQILIGLVVGLGITFFGLILGFIGVALIAAGESPLLVAPGIILIAIAYFGALVTIFLVDANTLVGIYYSLVREHTEDPAIPEGQPIVEAQKVLEEQGAPEEQEISEEQGIAEEQEVLEEPQEPQQISNEITNKE